MKISFNEIDKIRVIWERTASHNVDPQKGFTPLCPDELPVPDGHLIGEELARQNKLFRLKTISRDIHPTNARWIATEEFPQFTLIEGEKNVDMYWNAHCISGTYGAEILDELGKIEDFHFIVNKGVDIHLHPYTSVYQDQESKISTGLIEFYNQHNISTVIVGGLALNYCVGETVKDLSNAGFQVILNLGATKGLGTQKELDKYVEMLRNDFNILVVNSVDDIEIKTL